MPIPDPTVVFETYWRFASERHAIYLKRLRREPPPWTSDDVLKQYKFTDAFRACDRVSQYLIRDVIYNDKFPTDNQEYVFRILLFKLFNSIPAWEVLVKNFGVPTWKEFDQTAYAKALGDAWEDGAEIWNAAYVQNQNYRTDLPTKHERYLALVQAMMRDRITEQLLGPQKTKYSRAYEDTFTILSQYPRASSRCST
jgi:hypothetical protein